MPTRGTVTLVLGSMKSGKSEYLIKKIDRVKYSKKKSILLQPIRDTRQFVVRGDSPINNIKFEVKRIEGKISDHFKDLMIYDTILIDEGQFFDDLGIDCWTLAGYGKEVIVAALFGDRNLKPWKNISEAIPYADDIIKINAVCEFCHDESKATFTWSNIKDGSQVVIGDTEYKAACRECWQSHTQFKV